MMIVGIICIVGIIGIIDHRCIIGIVGIIEHHSDYEFKLFFRVKSNILLSVSAARKITNLKKGSLSIYKKFNVRIWWRHSGGADQTSKRPHIWILELVGLE